MPSRADLRWLGLAITAGIIILISTIVFVACYHVYQQPEVPRAAEILRKELENYASREGLDPSGFAVRSVQTQRTVVVFEVMHPGPRPHLLMVYVGPRGVKEFHRMIE